KYHIGRAESPPEFDKYDYMQKLEYWALIWGSVIMIITGFILWFPEFYTRFLPSWAFKVTETVHYFEAWLASLAIVVWHFFLVILHPEEYPMSLSWIHGRITVKEVKTHYKEWFNKMQANNHADSANIDIKQSVQDKKQE
ncbi:cytochrome b/b6 domain-containing protein, partial [candidate division KSB1 bacterium]